MRILIAAATLTCGLALVGCGGSPAEPGVPASAPVTASAAATSMAPVAADDACGLLTPQEINQVLGSDFGDGKQETDDARQVVTCTYTMTDDSSGVELPIALVAVGVSQLDGQESYDTNLDLATAYFGGEAEPTDVAGADKAYVVINEETQSPVIGMLVGDRFISVQIGLEGATVEQAQQLAATAASRVG
ncbi:MAG: DUF3558 family protein [Candidatus Nanopelagicales bacterium]